MYDFCSFDIWLTGHSELFPEQLFASSLLLFLPQHANRGTQLQHSKVPRHVSFLSCSPLMIEVDAGLSCLVSLMELYCGGNNVEGVREVGHLRGLLKLIILDLTGNPIAMHDDYRLYTIYHLRKLKVIHDMQWRQCACQCIHALCITCRP